MLTSGRPQSGLPYDSKAEHSIRHASTLIKTRYALQYNLNNNSQGAGLGATAHNPPDPH